MVRDLISIGNGMYTEWLLIHHFITLFEAFKTLLNMDTVLIGFALDDDRIHSPNEKYNISSYVKGIKTWARVIAKYQ